MASTAQSSADAAYQILGAAYKAAGANAFHKHLADGLGQLAEAVSALAEQQQRIEMYLASQQGK